MSERGIEIHNGYLDFPEGSPPALHMGTEASPLTQGEASQIIVSAVVNALALAGTVMAGQFLVVASVSLTGELRGLHVGTTINDAIVMTGGAYGIRIKQQILGTGSIVNAGAVTAFWEGIRLEMSSAAGAAMGYGITGIFMSNYNLGTITGNYFFLRLQENGTAKVTHAIYVRGGSGGMDYLFMLHSACAAFNQDSTPSGEAGWIRVDMGGPARWIKLYDTAPPNQP